MHLQGFIWNMVATESFDGFINHKLKRLKMLVNIVQIAEHADFPYESSIFTT